MPSLFGIIRANHARCWDEICSDPECWTNSHIAPVSYYDSHNMYNSAASADYGTMCAAMGERADALRTGKINLYHEWIALYMYGELLTDEEMNYRQELARKISE